MSVRQHLALLVCLSLGRASAQSPAAEVERPNGSFLTRNYRAAAIAPAQLKNSGRLAGLLRAGKLYLTVQDAIAVALENSLDLEIARYGPISSEWRYLRSQAGGPLRGVTAGNTVANQATSGQGVLGSQASAGLGGGNGGGGGGGGNAIISQIGPVTRNLDPVLQNTTAFAHITSPQSNTLQSQTSALVDSRRISNTVVQEGLLTGGFVQASTNYSYLQENSPSNILNPSVAPLVQIFARHDFLQAFGTAVNSRFIRVAANNRVIASETFRSQVMNTVSQVAGLYWDVVTAAETVKARRAILQVSEKLFNDLTAEVRLGAVARFEIFRAEAEFKTRQRELDLAIASKVQQDTILKSALSRDGLADPLLDGAEVVPLDAIQIPESDEAAPLRDLVARALKNRPDIAISKINDTNAEISALGTQNGVLPTLQGIAAISASGLAGTSQPQGDGVAADPYFVGGTAKAFGQIFRDDFKNRRAAVLFQGTIHNNIAQSDYGIEQLQLRQGDLITRRSINQLVVDISNQMIALRQARSRHSVAVDTLALQTELLGKERQKFALGDSTISLVIAAQRSEATARSTEVTARAAYNRARLGMEQTLGDTLEVHHVSMKDALAGQIGKVSDRSPAGVLH